VNAAGVLLTHGERALFVKRSDKATDHQGEWCCPGGSVEEGETAEQAARREFAEETGLSGLLTGDFNLIDDGTGFVTFRQGVNDEPVPTLNEEHSEYVWAPMADPPQPLHPGVRATLEKLEARRIAATMMAAVADSPLAAAAMAHDRREWDTNGWFEVLDNPLSTVGVYQYNEASVVKGGDPNKMVGVYRPAEELNNEETIKSLRLVPWTDDHPDALLGDEDQGLVPAEQKGVHGVIGEKTYYRDGTLYGNVKVFSEALARKQAAGKRELSLGYRCDFVPCEGVYEGTPYQYVQKNIRGNHLSSVRAGRMGSGVRVLDAAELSLSFALDMKEPGVRADELAGALDADTLKFIEDSFNSLVGELEGKGYSKVYATKVAGKVAAEKGMTGDSIPTGDTTVADMTEEEKMKMKMKKEADDRKAARDAARGARDSARDSMSSEEEMSADAAECAEDAAEEKDDDKDESKEAKDRKSARDRRMGARDARKMARDRSARDAKGKGMDAAEVQALVAKAVAGVKVPTMDEIVASVRPTIRREEAAKAALYGRVTPLIGAFDSAEMTHAEMAAYALDKLGAPKATDPVSALDYLLVGRAHAPQAGPLGAALDAAHGSEPAFLHAYLNS
jgi:8-oxo-dGTP pyrophosphatase MutT (NUDIX family)